MEELKLIKSLAKDSAGYFMGMAGNRLLRLGLFVFLARALGVNDFGLFTISYAILNITGTFCLFGMDNGYQRYIPVYLSKREYGKARGFLLTGLTVPFMLTALAVLAIFLFPHHLIMGWFKEKDLFQYLKYILIAAPFYYLCESILSATKSRRLFMSNGAIKSLRYSLILLCAGIVYLAGFRGSYILLSFLAGSVLTLMVSSRFLPLLFKNISGIKAQFEFKKWFVFLAPTVLTGSFYMLVSAVDRVFLGAMRTAEEAGIYDAAARLALQSAFITGAFTQAFLPTMSDLFHSGRMEPLQYLYKKVSLWGLNLQLLILLFVAQFASQIMRIFGRDFQHGAIILVVLAFSQIVEAVAGPTGYLLRLSNRQNQEMIIVVVMGAINIIMNFLLIPRYGPVGAAISASVVIAGIPAVLAFVIYRQDRILGAGIAAWKPAVAAFSTFIIIFYIKKLSLIAGAVVLPFFYLFMLFRLGLDEGDLAIINSIVKRIARLNPAT